MWETTGMKNLTTPRFPRLAAVPYVVVKWLSKKGRTPNELRIWLKKTIRTDVNFIKRIGVYSSNLQWRQHRCTQTKKSILAMEVEPVTITDPKFWKWSDQRLDATLGTRPTRSVFTRRSGTSQINQYFWENLTKVMGSSMGEMLQAQYIQQ